LHKGIENARREIFGHFYVLFRFSKRSDLICRVLIGRFLKFDGDRASNEKILIAV
jgi:hypothetical protein